MERYTSFKEFWPHYVREHAKPATRWLHFIGTLLILPLTLLAIFYSSYLIICVPLVAYGFAWTAHFFIEHNRPATFQYPLWSLFADFKMFWLMLIGSMPQEVERCQEATCEQD